jgi:hypothetical protein
MIYSGSQKSEVCPMPYALCPMPYALCPMPHALEYLIFLRKAIDLRELQGSLLDRTGLEVSESSLCRQLNRLKLGRQKKFNSQLTDI